MLLIKTTKKKTIDRNSYMEVETTYFAKSIQCFISKYLEKDAFT